MQTAIGTSSILPTQNFNLFRERHASFSPLKPLSTTMKPSFHHQQTLKATLSTEQTRIHLNNLDKLLQKQSDPNPPNYDPLPVRLETSSSPDRIRGRSGLLEGLSLETILPVMRAAEEISPRLLKKLQSLLSNSSEYSPRNSLANRWREYHGCNDWAGLLDPFDENLRREVVRYGEFIQAAYHCFHSNPATSENEACITRHVALPDRSYKVTKGLYATSSIGLPKWVDDVAPDLGWMSQRSSWIGYVAVCDDEREIQRMGRRDIVIALRGTSTCLEWTENMRNLLVHIPVGENEDSSSNHGQPKVECGFLSLYKTCGTHVPSLAKSVVEEIQRLKNLYKGETLSITVTGHSLGAALALLVADELSTCSPEVPVPIAVFSFGGPRVGNKSFAKKLESNNVKVLRIVNSQDVITRVPGMFVNEDLDRKLRECGADGVMNILDNNMPWAYSHVGTELKVDTKMSPYLKPNADVGCCHDLEAYLHLVDGFLASDSPFRSNAKRSLVKLLNEQKSNVKKLYKSKAKALSLNLNRDNSVNNRLEMSSCLPSPS